MADLATAWDLFADTSSVDVALLVAGRPTGVNGVQAANYIIDNVADVRKDCVVFVSPEKSDVVNAPGSETDNVVAFRNALTNSSYAVLDSGYKYQYDKYNDVYRWVPLNGDIAGLAARTDQVRDPWFSPAGFNRGAIKNVVKLAWNPTKAQRDVLYSADINPVVTFPGQGTVLFGDKTLLSQGSAFDYINVRRLFIILEKTIATAANQLLFEFNDDFTRLQFKNIVEPFLREVAGRRGITDFLVVCDETNNPAEIVDAAKFVGDIYIKPARSINFIQLNFVGVGSSVEFSEIVGQF
jgi:phage tail sheath protein FI